MTKPTDPDLILTVTRETLADGQKALQFIAKARDPQHGLYFARFPPVIFQADPQAHFQNLFHDIEQIPRWREED